MGLGDNDNGWCRDGDVDIVGVFMSEATYVEKSCKSGVSSRGFIVRIRDRLRPYSVVVS